MKGEPVVKRFVPLLLAALLLVAFFPVATPASAGPVWDVEGDHTTADGAGHSVTGAGKARSLGDPDGDGTVVVIYECDATANGPLVAPPTQARVRPASTPGCRLVKGTTTVDTLDGLSLPGGFVIDSGKGTHSETVPGFYQVCWKVAATFLDGTEVFDEDCT
jgi:hypothetical protein